MSCYSSCKMLRSIATQKTKITAIKAQSLWCKVRKSLWTWKTNTWKVWYFWSILTLLPPNWTRWMRWNSNSALFNTFISPWKASLVGWKISFSNLYFLWHISFVCGVMSRKYLQSSILHFHVENHNKSRSDKMSKLHILILLTRNNPKWRQVICCTFTN